MKRIIKVGFFVLLFDFKLSIYIKRVSPNFPKAIFFISFINQEPNSDKEEGRDVLMSIERNDTALLESEGKFFVFFVSFIVKYCNDTYFGFFHEIFCLVL